MTTERDSRTRLVLSWLREDTHENAERVLLQALDEVDTTPQRRSLGSAWRFLDMNNTVRAAIAVAAVLVVAFVGYTFLPRLGVGTPTVTPSPTPAPLAVGTFTSHGVSAQIDARGSGANVTGTLTVSDSGGEGTVTLECSGTTDGGLLVIAGLVTESTFDDYFIEGHRTGVVFQRGSPVEAVWWVALKGETPQPSCQSLLDSIDDAEAQDGLEPIGGSVEFGS